jgi:hypothetical protein
VCRVGGDEVLARRKRALVRSDKERKRRVRVAAGSQHTAPLEVDARPRDIARRELLGLDEQPVGRGELVPEPFNSRELRQHLRPPVLASLGSQLIAESRLGCVEVVEVPELA